MAKLPAAFLALAYHSLKQVFLSFEIIIILSVNVHNKKHKHLFVFIKGVH